MQQQVHVWRLVKGIFRKSVTAAEADEAVRK